MKRLTLTNHHGGDYLFPKFGFSLFDGAMTMSPTAAAGILFKREPNPATEITYRFLAPVLSAQFMTATTGKAKEIRNFPPEEPPRPLLDILTKFLFLLYKKLI